MRVDFKYDRIRRSGSRLLVSFIRERRHQSKLYTGPSGYSGKAT